MESLRRNISKVLPALLATCYGIAWVWSSSKPVAGVMLFAAIGLIASIPKIFFSMLFRMLFTVAITALVVIFPFLVPFLGILTLIGFFFVIRRVIKNWLLISVGFALYGLLFSVPLAARSRLASLGIEDNSVLLGCLSFLFGALVIGAIFVVLGGLGYTQLEIARFTFGLPGFFIILTISIITLTSDIVGGHGDYVHSDTGHSDEGRT